MGDGILVADLEGSKTNKTEVHYVELDHKCRSFSFSFCKFCVSKLVGFMYHY